ncbi:AtzH-like domain-containing protein [Nocardioides sp. 1609]|uniref:AtzH-like domain-containing protein n=1 Tax=Nocardioides sp. 1609 TaxID=2508327 RepID=UPI00106F7B32|nr:AtzH-like domain-containing protein [Nocardioides sp. 1609]
MSTPDSAAPDGLLAAFEEYERALMTNDLDALDRLFAPGADTLRGDADGLLVGHDRISAFRGGRGGAPSRTLVEVHVRTVDEDHALVVAVTEPVRGGRSQQTQLWERRAGAWVVTAAHVAVPAPALDTRVWRVVGAPLVPATGRGVLDGETVAVKDLYAVAGQRVGAGNPTWLAEASVEPSHAAAVAALLGAGAAVAGIARTDELAYSLAGTNAHTGTPPNPRAPRRVPGGSSSGSASAVGLGHATIGLGTDTGGSIRVPAAYQGLFGIRTTHDAVDRTGLVPLAPSFDTVGWLTRDADLLRRVGDVLLPAPAAGRPRAADLVVVPALLDLADPDVGTAIHAWTAALPVTEEQWDLGALTSWRAAFQALQAREAWLAHGAWLEGRLDVLGADVRGRFANAATVSADRADDARATVAAARAQLHDLVGERVLVLPSAPSVAPYPGDGAGAVRDATLALTCLAGVGGLPAVSLPLSTADGLPCGVCLVAAPGRDRDLLDLAARLTG